VGLVINWFRLNWGLKFLKVLRKGNGPRLFLLEGPFKKGKFFRREGRGFKVFEGLALRTPIQL